jgi:hypothetical protein
MLRGNNWARWLALAWIAFHVVVSFFHSLQEVVVHSLLFMLIAYFLFSPEARAYFRHREKMGVQTGHPDRPRSVGSTKHEEGTSITAKPSTSRSLSGADLRSW